VIRGPDASPRLSVVVASRNDLHGGNILKRMRLFVQALLDQTRSYVFPIELIFVEWNPPLDQPPLCDVLPKPARGDCLTLRYIRVPAHVHRRYRRSDDIPLFQMIAKNVGIRRARGRWVLCTNIDLLFSDELIRALATEHLRNDTYYRANRCDVPDQLDDTWDIARQLAWCRKNVMQRLGRDMRFKNINLELVGLQGKGFAKKCLFDKLAFGMSLFWSAEKRRFYQLDTFACGDFTLMLKEAWEAIQGYVELDLYSLHVDSLGVISAAALGYRQHVFHPEACTYHIDHPAGWSALSPLDKVRFLEQRPALDYSLVYEVGLHAMKAGKPLGLNPPDWGFADLDFEEFTFVGGMVSAGVVALKAASGG
jgi:hypothetical protein